MHYKYNIYFNMILESLNENKNKILFIKLFAACAQDFLKEKNPKTFLVFLNMIYK